MGYPNPPSLCRKRHKSERITYFSRLAAHFSVELDDCMYIPKILLPSKEKRPRRKIIKHYPLDAYCGQDTGFLIRCCNYMGKWVFMNGRVKNKLRRCIDRFFCEWEGRTTQGSNAGVTFLWMGGLRISLRKRDTKISWMEELGVFLSQGRCQRGLHEWAGYGRHTRLLIYSLIHSFMIPTWKWMLISEYGTSC